ncbi:MAG TPA: succinate dehydrogenase/fumarate reductase iron-sulfur subunit [Verrucomicrobiota bacterium]|nr:succinate dehydrogenase/fumarate reductase iron-sulfur subunit [Verrucomicrobiota bacterium]HNU49795.1 succinate dehydrogenase/fumarate reductase iron-sulfur subunit [Verrucomicrobiota bacterium]
MRLTLKVCRQKDAASAPTWETIEATGLSDGMSFLEMLDVVNDRLTLEGRDPIAFDSDCREGVCGCCALVINGSPHGGHRGTTVCQLHLRHFRDGETVVLEPWRAQAFPVIKDLIVDRGALDRIMQAGGFVSVNTGGAPDGNAMPIAKAAADRAMDAAVCIGCGACVAACKNASAMLFVGAKVSHLALLPQGRVERDRRALAMVQAMDEAGFGGCTVTGACAAVCPKEISLECIARLNREYGLAMLKGE